MEDSGKIPIKYKGETIGYADNIEHRDEYGGLRDMVITNQGLWNKILENNSQTIGISSRARGIVTSRRFPFLNGDSEDKVIRDSPFEYEVMSMTAGDKFNDDRESREWNRSFEKDSIVILDESWMNEVEKKKYKDLIGKTGKVLECRCDMHAFGRGSLYYHKIQWSGGKITGVHDGTYDEYDFTPNGLFLSTSILESFYVKFLSDLKAIFTANNVEFGKGERILIDGKIVPGILCGEPRLPYNEHLKSCVEMIKLSMKL